VLIKKYVFRKILGKEKKHVGVSGRLPMHIYSNYDPIGPSTHTSPGHSKPAFEAAPRPLRIQLEHDVAIAFCSNQAR
jgi:hypothetical protein